MYINIHTHHQTNAKDIKEIINLVLTPSEIPRAPGVLFTAGVHPWWCFEKDQNFLEKLATLIQHPLFVGLGEIGLDRSKGSSWQQQLWCFEQQIQFATIHKIPMVVIHCVKAYQDIWQGLMKSNYQGAILFHDYNGDPEFTKLAINRPHTNFSYGASLFRASSSGLDSLTFITRDRLFLETDDQQNRSIENVYRRASELLNIPLNQLLLDMQANASLLLGRAL